MAAVWGYIRVSTKDQNEDRQVKEILPLVTTKSHLIIEKVSGKDFDRPKWNALKDIMVEGDTLIIKSLDRLGRNYHQMKDEWLELNRRKIKVHVLDTPILNTDKYDNELMGDFAVNIVFEVLSFVAENERKTTLQRQKEGIKVARNKGIKFGRPNIQYPPNWKTVYNDWQNGNITAVEAMRQTKLKKSTFYKLVTEYKEKIS